MSRTNFTPTKHGFHFPNDFVNKIANIPFYWEVETRGRCGGMAYAALDFYFAGLPIPTHNTTDFPSSMHVPSDGTRLADYIYRRLLDSFFKITALKYIIWTKADDNPTWFYKGVIKWTKEDEFPKLCRRIDDGNPLIVGLIKATHLDDIGHNHQAVAYGYDFDANSKAIKVYIYDNNHPNQEVVLSTDPANPHVNASTGEVWRGFLFMIIFIDDRHILILHYQKASQ